MAQKPRIYYTDTHKALMWERWRQGESLQKIAQLFGRNHSSISRILAETGGIRPAPRCRSRLALTLAEREEITVARTAIEPPRPISVLGIGHDVQSHVNWQRTGGCLISWPANSNYSGPRNRLPVG
jgi:hypothetical protein